MQTRENKSPKYDIIVVSAILIVSLLATGLMLVFRRGGAVAVVEIGGERVAEYPLAVEGTYSLNGGTNILVIEDGTAYLSDADCPDLTCVKTGKIKYIGQSIVCLPNRLAVVIEGEGDGVDIVS